MSIFSSNSLFLHKLSYNKIKYNRGEHMKTNGVIMQYFHWYIKPETHLWQQLTKDAKHLHDIGITAIWMPPAYKGAGGQNDTGYGVYDLYDLGEFNQKGSVPTKYGTKDEYLSCIKALQQQIDVYADVVLNHRIGADEFETVIAKEVNRLNTRQLISDDETIKVATKFTFPNRHQKYSDFCWNCTHFDGIDYDENTHRNSIFLFKNKNWDEEVDDEHGNYDYLMGADIDFHNEEAVHEIYHWANWYIELTQLDGFRLDAVKHIQASFFKDFLINMRRQFHRELFSVGEYWHGDVKHLISYLEEVNYSMSLFDVPLHFQFFHASQNENFDMRTIFDNTLTQKCPIHSVTFVDNHDTEPSQALGSFVSDWFKPLAYALILLRNEGYPCVFYGDYYGISYENISPKKELLDKLLYLRKTYCYDYQDDYFDDAHIIGWVKKQDSNHAPIVIIMSNRQNGEKEMDVGKDFTGMVFYDFLGHVSETVIINDSGKGKFKTADQSVSVYIKKQ